MNIFFLSMSPKQAARWHANIHIVKMIVETAQLLCNVHHRAREKASFCLAPFMPRARIPYRESASGHRKLGSMIWVAESLGNYRWAVQLGLELCNEYNRGRGRAAGKTSKHKTEKVLEWLRDHEPNFTRVRRRPVEKRHLAMPDKFKKATTSVEAYRDYYYSKRRTMPMEWPEGRVPEWWTARQEAGRRKRPEAAKKIGSATRPTSSKAGAAMERASQKARALLRPSPQKRASTEDVGEQRPSKRPILPLARSTSSLS
mmetsp:Transcript_85650/g.239272  ORF Transcript_85650/g.239272 Transcript_85650/m.239272 type:complete len:258 (+) Transcript_85650:142-915(+)